MSIQQFCLRWNNHQPNLISVFTTLLRSESLVDVTLAAEGKHLQAHRVVLSACSSYFQSLFTVNPCQHPIVILKDVKYNDLKIMVDFMYYGEVSVSQEQLPAILKTAEMLKIKGLADTEPHISSMKSESASSDKAELLTSGDATWGSDSIRRSPSPMSPSLRRKRFRKSSTGSGSGSTERTSEEISNELSLGVTLVKPEPVSYTPEGESGGRSDSSLRNSTQEPSTDSEPRDGSQDSTEDDPLTMNMSHDSSVGVETQVADTGPGPSTSHQSMASQGVWESFKNPNVFQDVSLRSSESSWFPPLTFSLPYQSNLTAQANSPRAKLVETAQGKKLIVCNKEVPVNMLRAIRAVLLQNYSINKAAIMYKVSQSTLWRYVGLLPLSVGEKDLRDFITYDVPMKEESGIPTSYATR